MSNSSDTDVTEEYHVAGSKPKWRPHLKNVFNVI